MVAKKIKHVRKRKWIEQDRSRKRQEKKTKVQRGGQPMWTMRCTNLEKTTICPAITAECRK